MGNATPYASTSRSPRHPSGGERRNHSFEGPDNRGRVALDNDIVGETRRDQFLEHETSVFRAFFQDVKSRRERGCLIGEYPLYME